MLLGFVTAASSLRVSVEHAGCGVGGVGWGPAAAPPFLWVSGMEVELFDGGGTVIFNAQFSSTDV